MQKVYSARSITKEEIDYLLDLDQGDITISLLENLFAYTLKRNARFNPNDRFILKAGTLYNLKSEDTTVGRYLINKLLLTENLGKILGYINIVLDGDGLGWLDGTMSTFLLDDKITVAEFSEYIDKMQWLGFSTAKFIDAPLTTDMVITRDSVRKRKDELIEKHAEEIANVDITTISNIESELLGLAKNELKDLPDMEIYNSGSRGKFANNYKMTSIARGVVKSVSNPDKLYASMSTLDEGIPPEDQHIYGDILTAASYSRAMGTRQGGYEAKKIAAAFQGVIFGPINSDCGTKNTIPIKITGDNTKLLTDRYIVEGGRPLLINNENIKGYIGQIVNLRSPMYCKDEHICNKCAGDLYYKLGIDNVGLISNVIGSSMTTLALKLFHDTSIKLKEVDFEEYLY